MSPWREESNRAPWIAALTDTRTIQAALQIIMQAIVENRIDEDDGGFCCAKFGQSCARASRFLEA